MLFRWLEPAILKVEGASYDSETFESAYFSKYHNTLVAQEGHLGITAEQQATAYGAYQILGENLARHHGLSSAGLHQFLESPDKQRSVARKQFYIMLNQLVKRRGWRWPGYIFSMWNAGINYNQAYSDAILRNL